MLDDIEQEFRSGPSSLDLARAKQVVVHFGLAGAAILEEGTLKRLIFLPEELEGVWQDAAAWPKLRSRARC